MSSVTPDTPRRYPAVRGRGYPSGIGYRSRAGSFRRRADRMRGFEIAPYRTIPASLFLVDAGTSGGYPATWSQVRMSHGLYDMPPHTRDNHAHAPAQSRPRKYASGCVALDDRAMGCTRLHVHATAQRRPRTHHTARIGRCDVTEPHSPRSNRTITHGEKRHAQLKGLSISMSIAHCRRRLDLITHVRQVAPHTPRHRCRAVADCAALAPPPPNEPSPPK